jgi:hypothetical protein
VLHGHERVSSLDGPAPRDIGRCRVSDSLQFTQGVRAAQLVLDIEIGVIRCPRVMDRDPTEPAQNSGVVDPVLAALGMADDQGVAVGAGAVHPMQRAGHPQSGLVEPDDVSSGDTVGHDAEKLTQPVSGPFRHPCHGGVGDRRNCPTYK